MTMTKEEVYVTMTFLDNDYREIITKAVCGRGRKLTKSMHHITPSHKPSSILGCWVINHIYRAKQKSANIVEIHGSYDVNIWYSFNDNTKTEVVSEKVNYCDEVKLTNQDENCLHGECDEVIAKVVQQPNCLQCKIEKQGNQIAVEVEREFVVKVIGETKVNVKVCPPRKSDSHGHDHKGDKFKGDDFHGNAREDFIKGKRR